MKVDNYVCVNRLFLILHFLTDFYHSKRIEDYQEKRLVVLIKNAGKSIQHSIYGRDCISKYSRNT